MLFATCLSNPILLIIKCMLTRLLLIFLSTCSLILGLPIQDRTLPEAAISELAAALGIPPGSDLVAETQKQWLRPPGKERWETVENFSDEERELILNWAEKEELFAAWNPLHSQYDKAVILGATTHSMQTRLHYLIDLWSNGIRFSGIVWLTGDRPLDPRIETFTDTHKTESDAARMVWEEAELPADMRSLPVTFVTTPMKEICGKLVRPNTADTIITWLGTDPNPCTLLVVSHQPYCGYQFGVIKALLPDEYPFDLVGPAIDNASPSTVLDTVARWMYVENQIALTTRAE